MRTSGERGGGSHPGWAGGWAEMGWGFPNAWGTHVSPRPLPCDLRCWECPWRDHVSACVRVISVWQPLVARLLSRIEVLRWGARPSIPGRIPHLQLTWRCQYQQPLNELGGWRRWGLGRNLPPIWGHNSPRGMALMMAEGQWGVPVRSKAGSGGKETTTLPRSHPGSPGWQALSRIRGTLFISFLYF